MLDNDGLQVTINNETTTIEVVDSNVVVTIPSPETSVVIADQPNAVTSKSFGCCIGNGVDVITPGLRSLSIPFSGTITSYQIVGDDPTGSITIDIKKASFAQYNPPVNYGTSICGGNEVVLDSESKNADATLTGWTLSFSAGDIITFQIVSATQHTAVTLVIKAYVVGE